MNSGIVDQLQQSNADKIKFAVTDIDGVLRADLRESQKENDGFIVHQSIDVLKWNTAIPVGPLTATWQILKVVKEGSSSATEMVSAMVSQLNITRMVR